MTEVPIMYWVLLAFFCIGLLTFLIVITPSGVTQMITNNIVEQSIKSGKPRYRTEDGSLTEVPTETDAEVRARIEERFEILDFMVKESIAGNCRSCIIAGPAGLGKSYNVEGPLKEWDKAGHRHTIAKGYLRPTGLYKLLWDHRREGNVLVFDDNDSVFDDEISLNLLKAVLDTTEVRTVSYRSERQMKSDVDGEKIPKEFDFHGTVMFITNLDFDKRIQEEGKNWQHLAALISRSHYIDLGIKTVQDYMVQIGRVAELGLFKSKNITKAEEADVINFMKMNTHRLRELSLRMALKLADIRTSKVKNWKKVARVTTCR